MHYQLNKKFTLEDARIVNDGAGGYRKDWVALGQIWGQITAQSTREALDEERAQNIHTLELILRNGPRNAQARPKLGQRLRSSDVAYHITSVAVLPQSPLYLKVTAKAEHMI